MFWVLLLLSALSTEVFTRYTLLDQNYYDLDNVKDIFEEFIIKYNKEYDDDEYEHRLDVFKDSLRKINEWNEKNPGTYGLNEFSDLTNEEFSQIYLGFNGNFSSEPIHLEIDEVGRSGPPEYLDWRDYGVVTPVKDQQTCGSCYVFSAVAHIESQFALKHGPNTQILLSEQQALDCDELDDGCHGGLPGNVIISLASHGGLMPEQWYKYVSEKLNCKLNTKNIIVKVKGISFEGLLSEEMLKYAVATYGPLSIALHVTEEFRYVKSSKVFTPHYDNSTGGHAVLLVGYGTENDEDYWIIKNSWSSRWGDRGYVRLRRGIGAYDIGHYVVMADIE
ncbi:ervatamin-B-like [Zerene cesonia]|uniref:ervatamin-B-like n=1 Tax=Zerene cesonia TaxID=33412 RepID=UPI0018E4E94D|nr:ervatamin-B-like [Zerene cesonia]